MDTGADLEADLADSPGDFERAPNSAGRAVERGVEAVPCGVVLDALPSAQRLADEGVMALDKRLPGGVAEPRLDDGRIHDVGEEHGRNEGVELDRRAFYAHESADFVDDGHHRRDGPGLSRDLPQLGAGDHG